MASSQAGAIGRENKWNRNLGSAETEGDRRKRDARETSGAL